MLPYAENDMTFMWVFQPDICTRAKPKKWFADNITDIMEWPPQSPDLNPIENLWTDVKKAVLTWSPTLWKFVKGSWKRIPISRCQDLVDSMPRRCAAVMSNKGYSIICFRHCN